MPEGHTIHRLALDHTRDLVGGPLSVSSPQGRFAEGASRLDERVLRKV
ncbi:MAG: Fpg/Nei family DNA glycosylase, partial [Actinomycetota bacterium]|nr:Fpg/Nei family DNA glycosylase [Actinomycetota bacterium]